MGGEIPKQFRLIAGRPVLMRTVEAFLAAYSDIHVVLVLPHDQQAYWAALCQDYAFRAPMTIADGGATRFHSVQNGLALIPDEDECIVGVHDGVRPFPSVEVIRNCYETAREKKAVIPVIPVVETVRHLTGDLTRGQEHCATRAPHRCSSPHVRSPHVRSVTVPRDEYRLVQTPQTFDIQLLKAANTQPYTDAFTDDASVVESYGHAITLVDGNRENIKITTPGDLRMAEMLI
jgi:2-C-methyl-D-erythritol 4-phosphate cytidylyltransferase